MSTLSGMSPLRVRAVLFDLGFTLWHHTDERSWATLEAEANLRAVAVMRALLPIRSLATAADEALGASLRILVEAAIMQQHHATPDEEPDFTAITACALRALGISPVDLRLGAQVYEALRIRAAGSRVLDADVLDTLAALRARGYLLGIVTNRHYGGTPFLADLQQMGLLDSIEPGHVAISADLGYRKPHPAIYRQVLERLNVAPAEAAMVGDSLIADIFGAQQLGLVTIWKPKPHYWTEAHVSQSAHRDLECQPTDDAEPAMRPTRQMGTNVSLDAMLFTLARRQAQEHDARAIRIALPDAVIMRVSEVLDLFPLRSA